MAPLHLTTREPHRLGRAVCADKGFGDGGATVAKGCGASESLRQPNEERLKRLLEKQRPKNYMSRIFVACMPGKLYEPFRIYSLWLILQVWDSSLFNMSCW